MNRSERRSAEQRAVEGFTLTGPAEAPPGQPVVLLGLRLPGMPCENTARWTLSWTYPLATGGSGSGSASGLTRPDGASFTVIVAMPDDGHPLGAVLYRAVVDCGDDLFTTPVLTVRTGTDNRLYGLLPEIYRVRDEQFDDRPLQMLLGVIGDQLRVVEADIAQLYADWFVETCQPRLLPYLAQLVGYRLLPAELPGAARSSRRQLPPYARRSIADAVHVRRRTGTFRLLTTLGADVTGWTSVPVEQPRLVLSTVDLRDPGAPRTLPDVRDPVALEEIGTAFDVTPRTVRISDTAGPPATVTPRLSAVAIAVWRASGYPVPARAGALGPQGDAVAPVPATRLGADRFTFNWLGRDAVLMTGVTPSDPRGTDAGTTVRPLGRARLHAHLQEFYGEAGSVCVFRRTGGPGGVVEPVPADEIVVADLTTWAAPRKSVIAIDPELGRIAATGDHPLLVRYCCGFPDALGGGAYPREPDPGAADDDAAWAELTASPAADAGDLADAAHRLLRARRELEAEWDDLPPARVELGLGRHRLPVRLDLRAGDRLALHAADGVRVEALCEDEPRSLRVEVAPPPPGTAPGRTTLTLDGLLIDGAIELHGRFDEVRLRHCTLVPPTGSGRGRAGLEVHGEVDRLQIDRSVVGPVRVGRDATATVALDVLDSILDAGSDATDCVAEDADSAAQVRLTAERVTFLGGLRVAAALGTDCIVTGRIRGHRAGERPIGLFTYSYVVGTHDGMRRGEGCQPDPDDRPGTAVGPVFLSRHYPSAWYAQLASSCPEAISAGAHDGASMGAYHDLDEPARADSLRRRLAESVPGAIASTVVWAG